MKYIYYALRLLGFMMLESLQIIWFPIIYKLRKDARVIVKHHHYVCGRFVLNGEWESNTKCYNRMIKYNSFQRWFYFWFVWIWLDDSVNDDIISTELMKEIYTKPSTSKFIKNRILKNNIMPNGNNKSYLESGARTYDTSTPTELMIVLQILYSSESNYKRTYFYTTNTRLIFNFKFLGKIYGWVPIKYTDGHKQVYELKY
jgi:hypothetical protein